MSIDALKIWEELKQWDICLEAVNFFNKIEMNRENALHQGKVNFDQPRNLQVDEKPSYRAAYYCSTEGYMEMHIKQNRYALEKYLQKSDLVDRKILFVDFGCGPMTAGLVFAELLDKYDIKRNNNIHYLGIDISCNMCSFAKKIGEKYTLYQSSEIFNSDRINDLQIPFSPDIAVLCFSHALAPGTLKGGEILPYVLAQSLAQDWHGIFKKFNECCKSIAIYQNPSGNFEENWHAFTAKLDRLGRSDDIVYSRNDIEDCYWRNRGWRKTSAMAMITGER